MAKKIKSLGEIAFTTDAERLSARVVARRATRPLADLPGLTQSRSTTEEERVLSKTADLIDPLTAVPRVRTPFDDIPFGFIIVSGAPNVGKSITTLALCYWQNYAYGVNQVPDVARYFAFSEPRAPRGEDSRSRIFVDNVQTFPSKIPEIFNQITDPIVPKILVIDSIGLAMRSFPGRGTKERGKTGTMAQGMEVADQEFCREVQGIAMKTGVVFGIVGNTEVPFVDALEGFIEGIMEITSPGVFNLRYRGAGRAGGKARTQSGDITVPAWAITKAAQHLGYAPIQLQDDSPFNSQVQDPLRQHIR